MKTRNRTTLLVGVCGLALAFTCGTAQAQNALGDGRMLDRNLQPGGPGINTRVRDIDSQIRLANAIVTGNAPGGQSFRGNVGYLAPGEFTQRLGSNDLFAFRRDAAPAAVAAQTGIRGTDALRYQFGLTTGTGIPGEFRGPLTFERAGSGARVADVASGLRSTSDFLTRQSLSPIIVGVRPIDADRSAAVSASPLIGVRALEVPLFAPSTPLRPELPDIDGRPRLDPATGEPDGRGDPEPGADGREADPFTGTGRPVSPTTRERPTSSYTGMEPLARGVQRPARRTSAIDLSVPTSQIAPQSVAQRTVLDQLRLELGVDRRPGSPGPDGELDPAAAPSPLGSELEQRLEDLRRRLAGDPAEPAAPTPGMDDQAVPPRPRPGEILGGPEPVPDEEEREQSRREAMRQAGIMDPSGAGLDQDTIEALRRSRITVRELQTPTVADNLVYAENMAAGQALLAQGRYFDAEERFVRAAAAIPGEAMASVGRIHAQIGAGLFMSASMNLRTLLTTNPELVPVRYAGNLLPTADRWLEIRQQLRGRIAGSDPGAARAAAILLAYLGYQFRDQDAIRDGLAPLQASPEMQVQRESTLISLLSAVWREDAAPTPPAATPEPQR